MNYRIYALIMYLIDEDRYVTMDELAEHVTMSKPTIRLDLERVASFLEDYNVKVVSKRGVGTKLEGSEEAFQGLRQNIVQQMKEGEEISERDYNILTYLLQNINQVVTIGDIAQEFHLSDFVIQQKITTLRPMLESFKVSLQAIQGKGILVQGDETHIRKLYARVLFHDSENYKGYSEPEKLRSNIFNMLNINPDPIFDAMRLSELEFGYNFTDESFQSMAIHIAIALKRVYDGVGVEEMVIEDTEIDPVAYQSAENLYRRIEQSYNVRFDDAEVYYIYLHLISTRISKDENISVDLENVNETVLNIANKIKYLVEDIKKVSVKDEYLNNLILHLRPTINRLEYNMELRNPLLQKIKKEYPESFGIAWMCNPIFVRTLGKELQEDEVAYLALHIEAMVESTKSMVRAMIVCSSGIGISQLLRTQIETKFRNLEILDIDSVMDFKRNNAYRKTDFIISTFPIDTEKPVILVNAILSNKDIEKIDDFISDVGVTFSNEALIKHVFIGKTWQTRTEVIEYVSDFLLNEDDVTSKFKESVFKREQIYSTEIGNYIALPHGGSPYVKTSQLVVVTLASPILWYEFEVDTVIFILMKETDKHVMINKLKRIYKKLYTDEFHEALIGAKNREEVIRLF